MERKVDVEFFERYKDEIARKIDDPTNRSKKNNLVFWNVPEGDEKEKGCVQFIEDFLENHMKIPDVGEILIQKTHRSPLYFNPRKQQLSGSQSSPRPIHARFVNEADKDNILTKNTVHFKEQSIWSETSEYHYHKGCFRKSQKGQKNP